MKIEKTIYETPVLRIIKMSFTEPVASSPLPDYHGDNDPDNPEGWD